MPEHGAEAVFAERLRAAREEIEEAAVAFELLRANGDRAGGQGRRLSELLAARQPLANARRAEGRGDDADRHAETLMHRVAERGDETAAHAGTAGLRVVRALPSGAGVSGDLAGFAASLLLAMIGRVRLAGDEKNFADADLLNHDLGQRLPFARRANRHFVPTTSGHGDSAKKARHARIEGKLLPLVREVRHRDFCPSREL